ncbi:MAG: NAD(P)/FAD-dependent oxidoreductase [Porticoccaceae bacterium]|nr:MAG: NAD(P)/FAD-dependent oxidoreductase [Porticoccaceae bacterium]
MTDNERFAEAIAIANIPALLMVLVQMTGDKRWLQDPYRPRRASGVSDNDSGGLGADIQQEIRAAALAAILAWKAGKPLALPEPSNAELVEMLTVAMGEKVPGQYGEMTAAQLGQAAMLWDRKIDVPPGFKVIVIGAGASGLCAAVNLKSAGVPFQVFERRESVGGVWQDNRYPGAGVDTPNHLYSFSFASYDWSQYFVLRDELHDYFESVADRFELREHISFNTDVLSAVYNADRQLWELNVRNPDGSVSNHAANVLISAAGIFNPPAFPDIPGLDSFSGEKWHSAEWPAGKSVAGKRVLMIGNGATAMQVGPEIQNQVEALTIFQRSPHWASPFEQFRTPVPEPIRFLFNEVPLYRNWYRMRLGWTYNDRVYDSLHKDPNWAHPERSLNATNDGHRAYFTDYIKRELGDRTDLLDKVLPTFPPFGKRMLMDNGWYRMLRNPKVTLVDSAIDHIEGNKLVTKDGVAHEGDVLLIATGFNVLQFLSTYDLVGRSGRNLREVWGDEDASAYLGTVIPDFPNFFTLYGPNLQPGHGGSFIFVAEMQVRYAMQMIDTMARNALGAVECKADVHDRYIEKVDAIHENMVWTHPGMTTYYRNSKGRIVVNSPYRNVDFFEMTRQVNLDDYVAEPRKAAS